MARVSGLTLAALVVLSCLQCAEHRPLPPRDAEPGTVAAGPTARSREQHEANPNGLAGQSTTAATTDRGSTEAGFNVRVNQTVGKREAETTIAVNPTDPLNIVAGSIQGTMDNQRDAFYSSSDGGSTWTEGTLVEPTHPDQTDPALAFCADGSVVYLVLSADLREPNTDPGVGVFLFRSTDGGLTWPSSSTVANSPFGFPFLDKPWVTCDTTNSAFSNRIYAEWMEFSAGQSIKLKWSADFGGQWSPAVTVSDTTNAQNQAVLAVGPNGEVYVAWDWIANSGDPDGEIHFDRSTDGGVTFGTDVVATDFIGIPDDPNFLHISYPSMDVDRSDGPHRGNIYIAWADDRHGDPDVLLVRSTDGGATWSAPVRVNDDPHGTGAEQFHQWLTVDPNGRVIVTFNDRRRYPGQTPYETWGAISRDGGATFDTNFLISDVASDANSGTWLGDYAALAASADRLYALWPDLRNGIADRDVYTDPYRNTFAYDEVRGLAWLDRDNLDFETQDARFGTDLDYDVLSGFLGELRADDGFDRATCAAPAWPDAPFTDTRTPPAGDGLYYLLRAHGPDGVGTYGDGVPAARPNVRDALDETIAACP